MPIDEKRMGIWRRSLLAVAVATVGAAAGGVAGYLGTTRAIMNNSPVFYLEGSSRDTPFDETYRAWARLGALDAANEGCGGQSVSAAALKREAEVISILEAKSKGLNLHPPLDLARAIVAYRTAVVSESRSDETARREAIRQELTLLQAAGWTEPTHDKIATMIRGWDGCQPANVHSGEAK